MTKFKPGQIMFHKLFHYRGVILKVDETGPSIKKCTLS